MKGFDNGYTLIELLIVIIIIGILASVAVSKYMRSVEKCRQAEAFNILGMLRLAEYRYTLETGVYSPSIGDLDFEDPNKLPGRYFDYDIPSAGGNTFQVRATRNAYRNLFGYGNYSIALDQDGNISSDF